MRNIRLLVACTAIFALVFAASCGDDDGGDPDPCNYNSLCEPGLGETAANCTDCQTGPVCGNGDCEIGENETNCPEDCAAVCNNDGTCDAGETTANCPADCPGDQCITVEDLIEQNGCPGQSCALLDAGAIGCSAAGTTANYAECAAAGTCLPGAVCAGTGGVSHCMPFCDMINPSCPGNGSCMFEIPTSDGNVGLCGEGDDCDPFAVTGCGTGEGCYFAAGGTTICSTAGTVAVGASCQYLDECEPGLACVGSPGACAELCDAAFTCTNGTCQSIGTIPSFPLIGFCQ